MAKVNEAALHIGAVAVIHRFGSSLNAHVHLHVCVLDGVFEMVAGDADADAKSSPPGVHRYFGVQAPNSPLRASVTAMAQTVPAQIESVQVGSATTSAGAPGVAPLGNAFQAPPDPAPPKRSPAHYLWAVLIAHIYAVFALLCPMCGGQMIVLSNALFP